MGEGGGKGGENKVISYHIVFIHTCFRIKIRGDFILTLNGLNWLNGEIIQFYFSMIVSNTELFVDTFTIFFYQQLESGINSVLQW